MASSVRASELSLSNICKELARVRYKWFRIGTQLAVPYHKLKEFEREAAVADPLSSTFNYLLRNGSAEGSPLTWSCVVEALSNDHVGEQGLAASLSRKYCKKDESNYEVQLDLRTICEELARVEYKWFRIGTQLSVPHHKLKDFEKEADPLSSIFHYLLCNGSADDNPLNWSCIVAALKSSHVGEDELATTICKKYCADERGFVVSTILEGTDGKNTPLRSKSLVSRETQTLTPLPSKLRIHVPVHCAAVKATSHEFDMKPEGDAKLILDVSIRDASTDMPFKCVVALQSDSITSDKQKVVCCLSISVDIAGDVIKQRSEAEACDLKLFDVWRSKKSKYIENGHARFYMCFYKADVNYIVTLNIDSVLDEEAVPFGGYAVEHYTGFFSTYKTVGRNAFNPPPKKSFEGAIASKRFNTLMSVYNKQFYEGKMHDANMIMSKMTSSDSSADPDIKLYMLVTKATEKSLQPQTLLDLRDILKQCQSMDSRNGFLLEGFVAMALSQVHSLQGGREKAVSYMHHSRSICLEATPSHFTSCVFFNHARNTIGANQDSMTPAIKRRILELFDRAIADSYYGTGWERMMTFNGHVYKALFCLNGTIDIRPPTQSIYVPMREDISLAEQHLKAAPLEVVCDVHMHKVIYDIAMSDLNRWKGEKTEAREFIERARSVCVEKGYFVTRIPAMDDRVKLLKPDTIDEILEMFQTPC